MVNDFPESRYKHVYNVGLKMYDYAKNVLKWSDERCVQMFVLGNIHDICYEFKNTDKEQAAYVADALKNQYNYTEEIRHHYQLTNDYQSEELDLLYFGDSTVDGFGDWCSFDERLNDIKRRYGEHSQCFADTKNIIDYLIDKGFNDKCQIGK